MALVQKKPQAKPKTLSFVKQQPGGRQQRLLIWAHFSASNRKYRKNYHNIEKYTAHFPKKSLIKANSRNCSAKIPTHNRKHKQIPHHSPYKNERTKEKSQRWQNVSNQPNPQNATGNRMMTPVAESRHRRLGNIHFYLPFRALYIIFAKITY